MFYCSKDKSKLESFQPNLEAIYEPPTYFYQDVICEGFFWVPVVDVDKKEALENQLPPGIWLSETTTSTYWVC